MCRHVQFGMVVGPQINARSSFLEELATAPRFASGRYFHNADHSVWAVTLLTSHFNLTSVAGQGPQYILNNVTLWAGANFAEAQPFINQAIADVPTLQVCCVCAASLRVVFVLPARVLSFCGHRHAHAAGTAGVCLLAQPSHLPLSLALLPCQVHACCRSFLQAILLFAALLLPAPPIPQSMRAV